MLDRVSDPTDDKSSKAITEALEKLHEARRRFDDTTETFTRAVFDYGYETGWEEGFNNGWEAAWELIRQKEADSKTRVKIEKIERPRGPSTTSSAALSRPVSRRRGTVVAEVLDFISRNPGMRGIEIAGAFTFNSPPVPERTIRTALHRLKKAKHIKNINGKWYVAETKE